MKKSTLFLKYWLCATLLLSIQYSIGQSVQPVFVAGSPGSTDLGFDFGFRPQPEPPVDGTYTLPDGINTVTIITDGTYFDWSSTLPVDAVIVKGGLNANVYYYDPEASGDQGLHPPLRPDNGQPYSISHIEFSYDYELDVIKNASANYSRTIDWTIEKTVYPDALYMFTGDQATTLFTVSVDKTVTESDWTAQGQIVISNNTPFAATIIDISDMISPDISVSIDCGVTFPFTLSPFNSLTCNYSVDLPDGSDRVNTVTVTTAGDVGGGTATADLIFGEPTVINGDEEVTVLDSNGESWLANNDASWIYEKTYVCDDDAGTDISTATIVENGHTDDAAVIVNCYTPVVQKTAETSLVRTWSWTIDKTADQNSLTLSPGQQFLVNYTVDVDAVVTDSDWAATGQIILYNPAPIDAVINDIDDIISPDIVVNVDCAIEFPYILGSGESLACSYEAALPDPSSRVNIATATFQNYAYAPDGSSIPAGTTDYSGSASVDFAIAAVNEIDACATIEDTALGSLGTVCAGVTPVIFSYSLWMGPYSEPGQYLEVNTASFLTSDTGTQGSDDWTVTVDVTNCILGGGYWKTHSSYGPAPYDDAWAGVAGVGEDTPFFLSGQTYYEVLWTIPKGNAYYILAKELIAAQLNLINGAAINAEVTDAIFQAYALFEVYTPNEIKKKSPLRDYFISLAMILNDYNNGLIIPSLCSQVEPLESISDVKEGSSDFNPSFDQFGSTDNMMVKTYPNPFKDAITISVVSPKDADIELNLFDIAGRQLIKPVSTTLRAGQNYEFRFDAGQVNAGVIIYRLTSEQESHTGKLIKMN